MYTATSYQTYTNLFSLEHAASSSAAGEKNAGPYLFAVNNGSTTWLGGKTPPATDSYVYGKTTLVVQPIPMSEATGLEGASHETLSKDSYSAIVGDHLTRTSAVTPKTPYNAKTLHVKGGQGWNATARPFQKIETDRDGFASSTFVTGVQDLVVTGVYPKYSSLTVYKLVKVRPTGHTESPGVSPLKTFEDQRTGGAKHYSNDHVRPTLALGTSSEAQPTGYTKAFDYKHTKRVVEVELYYKDESRPGSDLHFPNKRQAVDMVTATINGVVVSWPNDVSHLSGYTPAPTKTEVPGEFDDTYIGHSQLNEAKYDQIGAPAAFAQYDLDTPTSPTISDVLTTTTSNPITVVDTLISASLASSTSIISSATAPYANVSTTLSAGEASNPAACGGLQNQGAFIINVS